MVEQTPLSVLHELIDQHSALLYRYAYRLTGNSHEAEDLTQQTYLMAQQRGHQLRDREAARSWLLTILRNVFLKSKRHRGGRSLDSIEEPHTVVDSWSSSIDHEQLQLALLELAEEFRSPLVLFYFEEFTYQQIAEHMSVPIGTIMSRLSRAKAFLKKRLTEMNAVPESPRRTFNSPNQAPRAALSHG
jgi:RNA polymerase sigma-70 factor, ECF subfamily